MIGKFINIKTVAVLLLVLGACVVVFANEIWAESKKLETPAAAPDSAANSWIVRCDDIKDGEVVTGKYCEMVQSIFMTQKTTDAEAVQAQRLAEVAIGYPPTEKGKAAAVIIMPLGILVNEDVDLEIDGHKETDFDIRYCEASGCFAMLNLSEKIMSKLAKGNTLQLKSIAAVGRPVSIEMSLSGFAAAYNQIKPQ